MVMLPAQVQLTPQLQIQMVRSLSVDEGVSGMIYAEDGFNVTTSDEFFFDGY